ncbi:MAG TPA: efflux RND transporter permease subunit [Candidatus Dormibacteraeota bacterium]|jgi:CzcA family heavy metal efflux pump|nr:efflux RND transporter permease subunit [Candidatus Dormibacteraeota bacterium]
MNLAGGSRTLMRFIVSSSLRFRYLVVAAAVSMMVFGVLQIQNMRVDVFPEFAPPQVEVQTICTGLSTTDVESLVTVPLEQALNGTKGLDVMRSKSVPQLSSIVMVFKPGADLWQARQAVQERLATVQNSLPTWAAPPVMLPPLAATARVMQIGMTSKTTSQIAMSMEAYWTIVSRMLRVEGVANVAIWGEELQLRTVQLRPEDMQAHQVTLEGVMDATSNAVDTGLLKFSSGNVIGPGGNIQTGNQRINIQHVLPIVTPADLGKVTVQNAAGLPVQLDQIANVKEDHQPLIGDAIIGDQPGLMLVVEKLPWADTVKVTNGVEGVLKMLQPGLPGITFDPKIFQQADFIQTAIHNLTQALVLGFILVVVILLLFLFEWRVALISLLTIPLSLMAAMLVLYLRGDTVNTMTLAGLVIALGAVVDDAIIDVENILRRLRQARREGRDVSTARVILDASLEVRSPIVYATLIIVAAAVPVFLLPGLTGSFFQPLAISYTLAILASMAVALTVTPAMTLILLNRTHVERRESPVTRWLQRGYTGLLSRIVVRPRSVYAGFLAVTAAAVLLVPQMGSSFFPTFKERDFLIHMLTTPGTSAQEQERMVIRLGQDLRKIPGVLSFGTHIGQAFLGEEVAGVNFGENWLRVADDANLDKTLASVRQVIARYPGVYRDVMTYLNERIEEVLTGAKEPIVVRVYGQDLHTLHDIAKTIQHRLSTIPGIGDDHVDLTFDTPQIQVQVDLARAAQYGLKPGDVRRAAATLVAGEEVGDIFRNGRAYDTVVWSTPETRSSVAAISDLPLNTPDGRIVRLGDVASVDVQPNPSSIDRENDSRKIDVAAAVQGRDLGSVVGDVEKAVANLKLPEGYDAAVLGEYTERQGAQNSLFVVGILAALAILLLLQTSFRSWRLAVLILATLPMALVGGAIGAYLGGGIISIGSLVGFFTVFGIAARNGILLINHFQHLEDVEGEPFGQELVVRGARERLAPILMTSLATGLAVVPLVVLGYRPGDEIEYPLAVVILGGLLTSTLLNLFLVPSLYLRFGRRRGEGRGRRFALRRGH